MTITIQKALAGLQDLLFGEGSVVQNRAGTSVTIDKLNAGNIPYSGDADTNPPVVTIKEKIDSQLSSANTDAVNQTGHGFAVGQPIRSNGNNIYTEAQGNTTTNAECVGIVSTVVDSNNFVYASGGKITLTTGQWDLITGDAGGLVAMKAYSLSPDEAGKLVREDTYSWENGDVKKTIILALSTTDALVVNFIGFEIGEGAARGSSFIASDFLSNIWTFVHNFGTKRIIVQVFDENDQPVNNISFTPTSGNEINAIDVYFSDDLITAMSTNTWYIVAFSTGTTTITNISSSTPQEDNVTPDSGSTGEVADAGHAHPYYYAIVKDIKANNTEGGTFTAGAWQTRDLNDIETNITGCSLNSNQITLPAGTYEFEVEAPAYKVGRHKAKLRNISDSSDDIIGDSGYTPSADNVLDRSIIKGIIIITASKIFEIQHQCQTTYATSGFGLASNLSVSEVYTQVKIRKIG